MARRESEDDRSGEAGEQVAQHPARRRSTAEFVATREGPEDETAHVAEHPGLVQLGHEPIDAVGPLPHVLQEQDGGLARHPGIGGAEQRGQLRRGAAHEHAVRVAFAEHLDTGRRQRAHGGGLGHRCQQRRPVVRDRAARQTPFRHRAVERHETVSDVPRQQRREVAVADEHLRVGRQRPRIEVRQQLLAAVAATHRQQAANRRVAPGVDQLRHPQCRRPRHVAVAREHAIVPHGLEPEQPQLVGAARQIVGLHRAGRRHERHPVARLEASRPPPAGTRACLVKTHANVAISAATS